MPDAVVIGAGPNGLVGANLLADKGWSVVVVEAQPHVGGGVRSSEMIESGYINDHCSAFYPLTVVSEPMRSLELERFGLQWRHADVAIAHPALDGSCPAIHKTVDATAASLGAEDGAAWRRLFDEWHAVGDTITAALLNTSIPPIRPLLRLAVRRHRPELLDLARLAFLPVRRLGEERFATAGARRLLAGLALHADLPPEAALSGFFGFLLAGLAQEQGFPVPAGGAQTITNALVSRLHSINGTVLPGVAAERIVVRTGRAVAVELANGTVLDARRAVLAAVDAPQLYTRLLPASAVPDKIRRRIDHFAWDNATFKVDWNLDGAIPWSTDDARRSGTVHVVDSVDELSRNAAQLASGTIPDRPFLVLGQQSMTDSSRQPLGKETAWAYTHVPQSVDRDAAEELSGAWSVSESQRFADRIEERIERLAPGFRSLIRGRVVTSPADFTSRDASMPGGALNLGTGQLHQQLVFRPIPGWGRPETAIKGLFLASGSAHPGGGVHGSCGANAARAAVMHAMFRRPRH